MSAFSDRLIEARTKKGLSQKKLAEILNITPTRLNYWEKGKREPDVLMIKKLSLALEADPNFLVGIKSEENSNDVREENHIQKYKQLSPEGKDVIDTTTIKLLEYEHAQSQQRKKADNTKEEYSEEFTEEEVIEFKTLPKYDLPVSAGGGEFLDNDSYELVDVPVNADTQQANYIVRVSGDSMEPKFSHGDSVLVKQQQGLEYGQIGIFIIDNEGFIKKYGQEGLISLNPKYPIRIPTEYEEVRIVGKVIGKLEV